MAVVIACSLNRDFYWGKIPLTLALMDLASSM